MITRGYCVISFYKNGVQTRTTVHQTVARAFKRKRPHGTEVRHLDGVRSNNVAKNIIYGTKLENGRDKIKHGTSTRGESNGASKLTKIDVLNIRQKRMAGKTLSVLSKEYGVSVSHVHAIVSHVKWAWL